MAQGIAGMRAPTETDRAGCRSESGMRRRLDRLFADAVHVALLEFALGTPAPVA